MNPELKFTRPELASMFAWGAVGGMLPTIGRLAGTYGSNFEVPAPAIFGVCMALALYGFIGSVISRAMGHAEMKQSLFAGIAAPAIVLSVLNGATESKNKIAFFDIVSPAYAMNFIFPDKPPTLKFKTVTVSTNVKGQLPIANPLSISFSMSKSNVGGSLPYPNPWSVYTKQVNLTDDQTLTFEVPEDAATVRFGTKIVPLVEKGPTTIKLTVWTKTSFLTDFVWALGGKRTYEIQDLAATLAEASPAPP